MTDEEFPCSDCSYVGCVIWFKYIRKTPPVTDKEHEENKKIMSIMNDVLSKTGCRHQKPWKKEWQLKHPKPEENSQCATM